MERFLNRNLVLIAKKMFERTIPLDIQYPLNEGDIFTGRRHGVGYVKYRIVKLRVEPLENESRVVAYTKSGLVFDLHSGWLCKRDKNGQLQLSREVYICREPATRWSKGEK